MPYILPPKKDEVYTEQQNWCWVQYATATKPAAFIYESWGGYDDPKYHMNAAQKKKWKDFKFPRNNFKSTVAAYKKKGYVVVEPEDILELYKNYVPRSYNAAVRAKHIIPNAKGSDAGTNWVTTDAPINLIYDKTSVNSVYNKFLNSMTWGGKKPKNIPWKSPASYFWGYGRPLDFKGWHYVIPQVYVSDTVVLHNYQTGKVAVVTECEGDDDEAGYYAMGPVAFEWKLNPKLLAAMNKPIMSGKGQQYVMKGTGRGVKKPAAKKPTAKPKAKKKTAVKPKYYLHFGEDYTADKCPYTGKKFAMNTIQSAKALANHIYNLGPMPNESLVYADFTIDGEHYGNMAAIRWPDIIEAKTGEVAYRWKPSKEQKAAYRKKANAIKKAAKPAAKKPTAKPRAKAPAKKPMAKPKARPSPSQSAAATKVGVRKRGNDGSMWEVKKNKNGVHRWVRDSKSTKRAEDYWYWK